MAIACVSASSEYLSSHVTNDTKTRLLRPRDHSLAYAELYTAIATIFRRFDFELLDVVRERDIDPMRDCFVGEPSLESPGVRVTLRR